MYREQVRNDILASILDACLRAIGKYGMLNTTLAKIAEEANMSKGRLFYYYTTKKKILEDILTRYENTIFESRDDIYSSMPQTRKNRLKATVLALDTYFEGPKGLPCIIGIYDDPQLRERIAAFHSKLFSDIAEGSLHPERIALAMAMIDGKWVACQFGTTYSRDFKKEVLSECLKYIDAIDID